MYYTIYKITNIINNHYYIGMHKTSNLNDGYMGSGKLIKRAIQKYGLKFFSKEYLFIFDNEEDMKNKEKDLVVLEPGSYNLCPGGQGGFGYINKNKLNLESEAWKKAWPKNLKLGDISTLHSFVNRLSPEELIKYKNNIIQKRKEKLPYGTWINKKHTKESKLKMSLSNTHQKGSKNSQFGTCWITNRITNKKIQKEQLDFYVEQGYTKGRSNIKRKTS